MYCDIFHTVPYHEPTIYRDSSGKKNSLTVVGGEWSSLTTTRNKQNTPILGAIALKEFIGIDIDNNELFDRLHALVADSCTYVAVSLPFDANRGGHLLFSHTPKAYNLLKMLTAGLKHIKID